jgi:8-oxo-dGTP pyrophosphatase MutT (NUDIX family)
MVWKPRVTVASVIEQNGRFLMVEEKHHGQIVINQPAGHMEYGESLLDAVRRETLEETGWRVEPDALLGVFHMQRPDADRVYLRFTFSGYTLEHIKDFKLDSDILRTHWLTEDEIRDTSRFTVRSDLVLRAIEAYKAGVRYPLELLHYFTTDNT